MKAIARLILIPLFMLLPITVGYAQEFGGCVDVRGLPVVSIMRPDLNDVAMATFGPRSEPIILYNPNILQLARPQTRLFFYGHECGHHALAHAFRNIPLAQEQEADCFAIVTLVQAGKFNADDVQVVQEDIARFGRGDWTHLPGPQRAINLQQCLASAGIDLESSNNSRRTPPARERDHRRRSTEEEESSDLVTAAKEVVEKLVDEDYEGVRENFNEEMERGLSADKIEEVWRSVLQQAGSFKRQSAPRTGKVRGYDVVVIKCQMERGAIDVEVDFDSDGKIGGLWIRPAT